MSNTMNTPPTIRWQLLSTVSALALMSSVYGAGNAHAADNDSDRPALWIELGGQLDAISGTGEVFSPPFIAANADFPAFHPVSPAEAQRLPRYGLDTDGRISFQPDGSDWIFSASIRYGRSGGNRNIHNQTSVSMPTTSPLRRYFSTAALERFAETKALREEKHSTIDFQAGKDVGLGMLGHDSTSTISLGVRFAQFASNSSVNMYARPSVVFYAGPVAKYFPSYRAHAHSTREFKGVGPSISWDGSTPIAGNLADGAIAMDWGINGALLFGRQKTHTDHKTMKSGFHQKYSYVSPYINIYHATKASNRSRRVTVPNVGGFAGISYHYSDAKISLGYRADFFFGAIDGGIDTRKSTNLSFNGPFASISIGMGD